MYKENLALTNLQWLICHKTQPNQTKTQFYVYISIDIFNQLLRYDEVLFFFFFYFFLR